MKKQDRNVKARTAVHLELTVTEDTDEAITYALSAPSEMRWQLGPWSWAAFRYLRLKGQKIVMEQMRKRGPKRSLEVIRVDALETVHGTLPQASGLVPIAVQLATDVRALCLNWSEITGRPFLPPEEYQTADFFRSLGERLARKQKPIDNAKLMLVDGWERYGYDRMSKAELAAMVNQINQTNRSEEAIWKAYVTRLGLQSKTRSGAGSKA